MANGIFKNPADQSEALQKIKYYKHPDVDGVWHDTGKTDDRGGTIYNVLENEEGKSWGVSPSFFRNFVEVDEPIHPFKLDTNKYPDVETTPYGFIYNVNGKSITDLLEQDKQLETNSPRTKPGFSLAVNGDEVFYPDFDSAYKAAKGIK